MNADRATVSRLIDIYGAALSDRQRDVVDLYYNEDLSLAEISEHCGITRQGVRDAIRHGVETLYSLETALGFKAKGDRIAVLVSQLSSCDDLASAKLIADSILGEL